MAIGHFVWTDLSTYDLQTAKADYKALFRWSFKGDAAYAYAHHNGEPVAGIFPMPPRLQQMDMPSFWMSYVHVPSVEEAVERARQHEGAIIELEPQAFTDDARIALIRDPSGAGFTVYEGPDITPKSGPPGTVVARYHHVPDIELVRGFYSDLFDWRFERADGQPWPSYRILHPNGDQIATIEEVPETVRGRFRYWVPAFAVGDQTQTVSVLERLDGRQLNRLDTNSYLLADRQGAHFITQTTQGPRPDETSKDPVKAGPPLKALTGLMCIWLAVFLELQAFWGVLFLIWTWPALRNGRADFIEPVSRSAQPITYWALLGTWIALSVWLITSPLFPPV